MVTSMCFFSIFYVQQLLLSQALAYQYILNTEEKDTDLLSDKYPQPYPIGSNITWEWSVQSGLWAIVFEEFLLDNDNGDWLEVEDRMRRVRFSYESPPLVPFMSNGPWLALRFVTDGHTMKTSQGFKLRILYGRDSRDLELKVHDANNNGKDKDEGEDSDQSSLLVIAGILVGLAMLVVNGLIFLFVCRWHRRRYPLMETAGIRRGSGTNYSRRGQRPANGFISRQASQQHDQQHQQQQQQPQQQRQQHHQQQQQQQQQQRRQEAHELPRGDRPALQRSENPLDWIARAELNTSIQVAGMKSRPNIYTSTTAGKDRPGSLTPTLHDLANDDIDSRVRTFEASTDGGRNYRPDPLRHDPRTGSDSNNIYNNSLGIVDPTYILPLCGATASQDEDVSVKRRFDEDTTAVAAAMTWCHEPPQGQLQGIPILDVSGLKPPPYNSLEGPMQSNCYENVSAHWLNIPSNSNSQSVIYMNTNAYNNTTDSTAATTATNSSNNNNSNNCNAVRGYVEWPEASGQRTASSLTTLVGPVEMTMSTPLTKSASPEMTRKSRPTTPSISLTPRLGPCATGAVGCSVHVEVSPRSERRHEYPLPSLSSVQIVDGYAYLVPPTNCKDGDEPLLSEPETYSTRTSVKDLDTTQTAPTVTIEDMDSGAESQTHTIYENVHYSKSTC